MSVCIPTYNSARYLRAAIDSALAQDFSDLDVQVCDNASTDDTAALCASIHDPRLHYHRFDEFVTQAANWNRAVALGRGEFVVLLHADDELESGFLLAAVAALDAASAAVLVHCAVQHIDPAGHPMSVQSLAGAAPVSRGAVVVRRLLLEGCFVNPAGVLLRRDAFERVGPFTDHVVWGVDWHLWMRLALIGDFAYLAAPLARYREHASSGTAAVLQGARNAGDEIWVVDDVIPRLSIPREEALRLRIEARRCVAHRTWCHAERMSSEGHGVAARAGILAACRIDPKLARKARTWALLLATYVGHGCFSRLQTWAGSMVRRPSGGIQAAPQDKSRE